MLDDRTIERAARAAHAMNRAYCEALGDVSQPPWCEAPDWQKDSARQGARGILDGSIKTPEQSHESWLAEKVATGWTYGPIKNPEAKQHPCMVPYGDLPPEQRIKDHLFAAAVRFAACDV